MGEAARLFRWTDQSICGRRAGSLTAASGVGPDGGSWMPLRFTAGGAGRRLPWPSDRLARLASRWLWSRPGCSGEDPRRRPYRGLSCLLGLRVLAACLFACLAASSGRRGCWGFRWCAALSADLADAQVDDAAEGDRDETGKRPAPLGQVAHFAGPGKVGQAEGNEAGSRHECRDDWPPAVRVDQGEERDGEHSHAEVDAHAHDHAGGEIIRPDGDDGGSAWRVLALAGIASGPGQAAGAADGAGRVAKRAGSAPGREGDAGVVQDGGEFGGPFAVAFVADVIGEAAAGAADEVPGEALGEGVPGHRVLPGAGWVRSEER